MSEANVNPRPCVSPEFAGKLAEKFYNFEKISEIKELNSYCDQNFYIRGQRSNSCTTQQTETASRSLQDGEYVLKILNSDDSKHGEFVDAENEAMRFFRERNFPCSLVYPVAGSSQLKLSVQIPLCKDRTNEVSIIQEDVNSNISTSQECIIRLLSFLPGETAASLDKLTHENLFCIGQFVGKMSRTFQEFHYPMLRRRLDRWSVENFLCLEEYITSVKGEENRRLACEVLGRFATHVTPNLWLLRRGIIHFDISRTNLLIETRDDSFKVSGVIDFVDMRHSCLLFELACTLASFIDKDDVLVGSGHLVAGYQAAFPLPDIEFELLYDIVLTRLCQVFLITSKQESQNPENEYLSKTLVEYLGNLKAWLKNSKEEVVKYWRRISQVPNKTSNF